MIDRIEAVIRASRRAVSRSEWLARMLRLPVTADPASSPGLILLQIDGLSRPILEDAMRRGQMPFLKRLVAREKYRLHQHYSGIPSTTAAVQGELFYGVPAVVPGFNFMDRASHELVRMFEPTAAARVERELAEKGEPLLQGGSCYVDNYTGGAAEPHFCPAALGWGPALREASPFAAGFLMANPVSLLRAVALMVLETGLAIADGVRGVLDGYSIVQEMKFIPARVVISILLRELAENGARIDAARGLPIIHVNFLGFDEQSHRRGPDSPFARWCLKGIDSAIARIWKAAQRSVRRHYDVWIYSDHGQESVTPYHRLFDRSCAEAIAEVFSATLGEPVRFRSSGESGAQLVRAQLARSKAKTPAREANSDDDAEAGEPPRLSVAPLGPVALIYFDRPLGVEEREDVAKALVRDAQLPVVLAPDGADEALAWTSSGRFRLPQDGPRLLGTGHPHQAAVARDLAALAHHPDVGTFLACGWHAGRPGYISFARENGAHGGPGPLETAAFALLPPDAPVSIREEGYVRPRDLHRAALRFLGRIEAQPSTRAGRTACVRIMTYNVHSCIGMDGRLSPERIARVISRYDPDIVALQELDVGRSRTEGIDQAHLIARLLGMDFHFHPAVHVEEERYGDAILTHLPMRLVRAAPLPGLRQRPWREPRGALWVAIDVGGTEINVINTHLGLTERGRRRQISALVGPEWLGHPECTEPVIMCGDFNALPGSWVHRVVRRRLVDAQEAIKGHRPRGTFFGRFARIRIDHVFVDPTLEVRDVEVPNTAQTRVASDHLPLVVELGVPAS